ncbi:hypothetical protein JWZ98_21615 [Methylomonas sp. EFPC1]|uniref:hypothetical protein n=2 Tax=unclassified Methylomonas TaxID=2608980 RepID=UPI00105647AE|nr:MULTISPECIES: hypothetical protein [unclassified Methylomonas]QSB01201.1 hypothetical protein JWZ98_21615 [Methylomonas sp. EFPC1]
MTALYFAPLSIGLIKMELLQRDIEALEQERHQRLGQDAAAADQGPSAADSPVGKVKTLAVNKEFGESMRISGIALRF